MPSLKKELFIACKNRKSGGGFTIFEVILAIFILTVAVAASITLIQQTIVSASLNESRTIAAYLSQEGLEITRNIRDNNWLAQRTNPNISWKAGLGPGDYEASYSDVALSPNANRYLLINSVNGFYSYSGNISTTFKRKISIADLGVDTIQVTVLVSWEERNRTHSIQAVENLYNWYGY